ncbi:unnamed protein product, partial [Symbiodinium microadriaticum]
ILWSPHAAALLQRDLQRCAPKLLGQPLLLRRLSARQGGQRFYLLRSRDTGDVHAHLPAGPYHSRKRPRLDVPSQRRVHRHR